jgi:hypothetical protein
LNFLSDSELAILFFKTDGSTTPLVSSLHGPPYCILTAQASLSAAQVVNQMARLTHGPQMRFVIALRSVAEMRYPDNFQRLDVFLCRLD